MSWFWFQCRFQHFLRFPIPILDSDSSQNGTDSGIDSDSDYRIRASLVLIRSERDCTVTGNLTNPSLHMALSRLRTKFKVNCSPPHEVRKGNYWIRHRPSVRPFTSNNSKSFCFFMYVPCSRSCSLRENHHYTIKAGNTRATRTLVFLVHHRNRKRTIYFIWP